MLGLAWEIHLGVDLALVIDVLANQSDAGEDLGVLNVARAAAQTLAGAVGGVLLTVNRPKKT